MNSLCLTSKSWLRPFISLNTTLSQCSGYGQYDVVVVGGGHAGTEAACAAARCGARTLLLTQDLTTIGEMSCNPSFGGIGKGHLLREIDALDGVCARILDVSGIQYKILNKRKGPAVWGLRAQIDRKLYKTHLQKLMENYSANLEFKSGTVEDLIIEENSIGEKICTAVVLGNGEKLNCRRTIITTGTFLRGSINLGLDVRPAGRLGDAPSVGLATTLDDLGFPVGRMRTGTPPRLVKSTIDFSKCQVHRGDEEPTPFSFLSDRVWIEPSEQALCHMTHTNSRTHEIIKDTMHLNHHVRSEAGTAPRYCPSIESKVEMFSSKAHHQIWLEPEGLDCDLVYPQGLSCTMPAEYQQKLVNTIIGLEETVVAQPGYGVEYDYFDPTNLRQTFETRLVRNLYFAGQINGTTGYEEAAAQGLVAGVNAANAISNSKPLLLNRTNGYIGVLIDDLTQLGTNEPYRMFTGRAEFRLSLRPDNADLRLTQMGRESGCVTDERYDQFLATKSKLANAVKLLTETVYRRNEWSSKLGLPAKENNKLTSGKELVEKKHASINQLEPHIPGLPQLLSDSSICRNRVTIEVQYAQLLHSQKRIIEDIRREASLLIPEDLDLSKISGISNECQQVLMRARPPNLAAASRLPGITPAALVNVMIAVKKLQIRSKRSEEDTNKMENDCQTLHSLQ